jgi:hypothetical protein
MVKNTVHVAEVEPRVPEFAVLDKRDTLSSVCRPRELDDVWRGIGADDSGCGKLFRKFSR